eukprot:TRINITY_DN18464_c0_g1_i1.p2 TRINITY_DN18464_c0_g1~~TRINITY_DN18464_c0_g1_i1.p2  ORF type:complete len:108 (+),score=27.99 TRINITY_DN18464_c0_g1_i1:94-417(+)
MGAQLDCRTTINMMKVFFILTTLILAVSSAKGMMESEETKECEQCRCCEWNGGNGECPDCTCCPASVGCCPEHNWFCCPELYCAETPEDCARVDRRKKLINMAMRNQ